jgi:hypothetical protein
MTDLQSNTRTLVVCFMVAMGGLVPLRFVAEGQRVPAATAILGETTEQQEVVLPVLENNVEEVRLEAPYDKIDNQKPACVEKIEAQMVIDGLNQRIAEGGLTEEETVKMYETIWQIESEKCR